MKQPTAYQARARRWLLLGAFALGFSLIIARAFDLQVMQRDFLQGEGDARQLRVVSLPAHRGMILDRHGEPMAVSTPVDAVWANPRITLAQAPDLSALAEVLGMDEVALSERLSSRAQREFVYLRRQVTPDVAAQVTELNIAGVGLRREYRRYYPLGEAAAQLLGVTNIDDVGQEGLELAFESQLAGAPGAKRVLRDLHGRVIRDVEHIRAPRPGQNLQLTIDQRLQYLAYRELKSAVQAHGARAGSAVLMDIRTGDLLAVVNQPSLNPNNRETLHPDSFRNRAFIDVLEPGSTLKPFIIMAALESGQVQPDSLLETSPGTMRVGSHTIRDIRNFGRIDVSTMLVKSSNVGATQLALQLEPRHMWQTLFRAGFGQRTGSGFPGEATGILRDFIDWREVDRAVLGFGYGASVTLLQLTRAYAALAYEGQMVQPRLLMTDAAPRLDPAMPVGSAELVMRMLEESVGREGTGWRAAIEGYRIAGKTGTTRKAGPGGYLEGRYQALFAGVAPASDPRLALVVMIDEPSGDEFFGGQVAAPVFRNIMSGALRLWDIPPDHLPELRTVSDPSRGGPA